LIGQNLPSGNLFAQAIVPIIEKHGPGKRSGSRLHDPRRLPPRQPGLTMDGMENRRIVVFRSVILDIFWASQRGRPRHVSGKRGKRWGIGMSCPFGLPGRHGRDDCPVKIKSSQAGWHAIIPRQGSPDAAHSSAPPNSRINPVCGAARWGRRWTIGQARKGKPACQGPWGRGF
jgi:hypothetical protein